jgi:hypothetical protein
LFAREARGLQVVRGLDLKGPKAAGRVTGTQRGGGVGVPNSGERLVRWEHMVLYLRLTSEQGVYLTQTKGFFF